LQRTRGRTPPEPCRVGGMLDKGDACLLGGQCSSGTCIGAEVCGRCVETLVEGAPCQEDSDCGRDRACGASGCVAYGDLEAPCTDAPCHPDLACLEGKCKARLEAEDPCDPAAVPCALWPIELACHPVAAKCMPIDLADETSAPCGVLDEGFAICAPDLACRVQEGTDRGACGSIIDDGGSCGSEPHPWGGPCRAPAECIDDRCQIADVATCSPPSPP